MFTFSIHRVEGDCTRKRDVVTDEGSGKYVGNGESDGAEVG